jgi:hypothetical protein
MVRNKRRAALHLIVGSLATLLFVIGLLINGGIVAGSYRQQNIQGYQFTTTSAWAEASIVDNHDEFPGSKADWSCSIIGSCSTSAVLSEIQILTFPPTIDDEISDGVQLVSIAIPPLLPPPRTFREV